MGKNKKELEEEINKTDTSKKRWIREINFTFIDCRCVDRVIVYKDSSTNCPSCGNNIKYKIDD